MTDKSTCALRHRIEAAVILMLCGALSACGGPLSTASSMRVEVEVYKGPLSQELDTQWAELIGLVDEVKQSLTQYGNSLDHVIFPSKDCTWDREKFTLEKEDSSATSPVRLPRPASVPKTNSEGQAEQELAFSCLFLNEIRADVEDLGVIYQTLDADVGSDKNIRNDPFGVGFSGRICAEGHPSSEKCATMRKALRKISEVAARLKTKALYWANAHALGNPQSTFVRASVAGFTSMAAQYSNQLASRADALLKQLQGKRRELLPSSVFLRDTSPTDFPNLMAWNRAAAPALIAEMVFHPLSAFSTVESFDRIRVIERLFADHYWTNINTVYASGQGEVRMALIKDDIGNWNLKSFDSDPTELVDAYKDVTLAALESAADAAANSAAPGSTQAIDLASRLTRARFGSEGVTAGTFNIDSLHLRARARLEQLSRRDQERDKALQTMIDGSEARIADLKKEVAGLKEKIENPEKRAEGEDLAQLNATMEQKSMQLGEEQKKLKGNQEKRASLRKAAIGEAGRIIEDHEAVIDVLQESVLSSSPQSDDAGGE